ncbi:MAG TPA: polymorphic toxin-type HINT domain-containing protein, partial [Isosphaeraceae bacterium]|nr:polymorphic toxin-type HINT domain-containing protein [Isosphaeraceae bacterium]
AVQLLGQISSPESSQALAFLTLMSDSEDVRRAAIETLATRDAREFLDILIGSLRKPIRFEVRPVGGPGQPGALFIQGQAYNRMELFRPWNAPQFSPGPGDYFTQDANGLPVLNHMWLSRMTTKGGILKNGEWQPWSAAQWSDPSGAPAYLAQHAPGLANNPLAQKAAMLAATTNPMPPPELLKGNNYTPVITRDLEVPIGEMQLQALESAIVAERQLEQQVRALNLANASIEAWNTRVVSSLTTLTGQDLGNDGEAWAKWWLNDQGYAYSPKPESPRATLVEDVPLAFNQTPVSPRVINGPVVGYVRAHSCFAFGTPVQTRNGLKAIESIQLGDQVLTQDGSSGKLAYQPVIFTHHNRPSTTLKITLDQGESIVATPIHRFWKAGEGWAMARELKPGDLIRSVDGLARIDAISAEAVQPVFNLEVASGQSFFVGKTGLLVHDNSLVEPVSTPFDRPAMLASANQTAE